MILVHLHVINTKQLLVINMETVISIMPRPNNAGCEIELLGPNNSATVCETLNEILEQVPQ